MWGTPAIMEANLASCEPTSQKRDVGAPRREWVGRIRQNTGILRFAQDDGVRKGMWEIYWMVWEIYWIWMSDASLWPPPGVTCVCCGARQWSM
jgi:hypothetical protein